MAKAIVPVIIKLLAEADGSVEGAIGQVRAALENAGKNALSSAGLTTRTIVTNTADAIKSGYSDLKIDYISTKSIAQATTGLKSIQQSSLDLNSSLLKISDRFTAIQKAALDIRTAKPYDLLVTKAGELDAINDRITQALRAQKTAAEELAKAPKADILDAKTALDKAKALTSDLQKQATIIRGAYTSAFNEATKGLAALEKEVAKTAPKLAPATTKTPSQTAANNLEIELIGQQARANSAKLAAEQQVKKIAEDRLNLERRISDIVNNSAKLKVSGGLASLSGLASNAELAKSLAANQQAQLQKDIQKQLETTRANPNSPNIQSLRQITAQSKILADSLDRDAKKAEKSYSEAFKKISQEADKALKNPTQGSGGRLGAGLGIFSPLANQISSTIDSIIGSISGQAGIFRTTAGVQIGQALSQGIGQGIGEGADFAAIGANKLLEQFQKLELPAKQLIANVGTGIVVGAAAAAAAMGGLAFVAVKVSSDFEVLTAKLTTAFKSPVVAIERFQAALEIASKTPYNVEQVVGAQVQLAALGQRNIDILKLTVDLASGLNADLARTANEVGKASAGSLRGYQELRNTLGITQERLKEFGGVVDSQNRLLVTNEFQIRKNREALFALIRTDFGGSAERLSATLSGRISNLQDEVLKLAGAIGNSYLPTMKSAVQLTTDFFQALNSLPPGFKNLAAGSIATIAAVGALISGLAAASVALGVMGSAVAALSGPAFAPLLLALPGATAAVSVLNVVLNTVAVRTLPLLGTSLATAAGPLSLLVIAAGLVNTALVYQQEESERAGANIKVYAAEIANARRVNLQFKNDLVTVFNFPKDFFTDAETAEQKITKLKAAIKERGAFSVIQDLGLADVKLEDIQEKYVAQNKALEVQAEKLAKLRELRDAISIAIQENNARANEKDLDKPVNANTIKGVIEAFEKLNPQLASSTHSLLDIKGSSADAMKQLDQFIGVAEQSRSRLLLPVEMFKLLTDSISNVDKALDSVQKKIVKGEAFNKFALKVGDINLVNESLKRQSEILSDITKTIEDPKNNLRDANAKGAFSIAEATRALSGASGAQKELLEKYITTYDNVIELSNKRVKIGSEQDKYRLLEIEANEKVALAIIGKGAKEQQLVVVRAAIDAEKEKAALYQDDLKLYVKRLDLLNAATNDGERQRIQTEISKSTERIDAGKKAFDFVIEQKKKEAQLLEQIDTENYKTLKAKLETFLADTKEIIKGVAPKAGASNLLPGITTLNGEEVQTYTKRLTEVADRALTASEKIAIFRQKLLELENLKNTTNFSGLGNKSDEAQKAFRDNQRELEEGLAKAQLEKSKQVFRDNKTGQREDFKDFLLTTDKALSEAQDKTQKLAVLEDALVQLRKQQNTGLFKTNDYRAEENKLVAKIRDTQQEINKATADQVKELEKIRQTRIKDEIEILKVRAEGASGPELERINSELKGRKRQQIQAEFQELKAEKDLELTEALKNGKDKELILEKYRQKETDLIRKAYLEHAKAEQDKLKATTDRLQKEADELAGFRKNRVGGPNSPLISIEELSFRSGLSGFGSDADSRLDRQSDRFRSPFGPQGSAKLPSFESFKAKFEQENNLKLGKDGKPLPSSFDNLQSIQANQGTTVNAVINIDGHGVADADIAKRGAALALDAIKAAGKQTSLISGSQGSSISPKPFGAKDFGTGLDLGFSL